MENLTYHQQRILNQLFSPLVKTNPLEELERIIKFYYHVLKHEDIIIINYFKKSVEAKLTLILPSYFMFYQFDHYKEKYLEELYDHIEHSPDSIEIDFIDKCIFEQEGILNGSPEFYVQVDDDNFINAMQFVSENFLDEFKISSKRKIEFLQAKLNEDHITLNSELNPYSLLFVSREVYDNFLVYTSSYIIDFYIDYSYLKKRLEYEGLIHKTTDKEFMRIIYEDLKLISENRFRIFVDENKLRSLKKSYSTQRENNFNIVFGLE